MSRRRFDIAEGEVFFSGFSAQSLAQAKHLANRTHWLANAEIARGTKSGRTYLRGGGKTHTASAPGQAPAVDTGTMISNIVADVAGNSASTGALLRPRRIHGTAVGKARRLMTYPAELENKRRRPWLKPAARTALAEKPLRPSHVELLRRARA